MAKNTNNPKLHVRSSMMTPAAIYKAHRRHDGFGRSGVMAAEINIRGATCAQAHRNSRRAAGHEPGLSQSARDRACIYGGCRTGGAKPGDFGACAGACGGAAVGEEGDVENRHAEKDDDHGLQTAAQSEMARRQAVYVQGFRIWVADR